MNTVLKYIEQLNNSQKETNHSLDNRYTILNMIKTIKSIGAYVGIDTQNLENDYYIQEYPPFQKKPGEFNFYCYNKSDSTLNIIDYHINTNNDIPLVEAFTLQIDLESQEFIYHHFLNPNQQYKLDIIHQRITGILPQEAFNSYNPYSLTNMVIKNGFRKYGLSPNSIDDWRDMINNEKNKIETIKDDKYTWGTKDSLETLYKILEDTCGIFMYSCISNVSIEKAKKIVNTYKNDCRNVAKTLYLLDLIDYKMKHDNNIEKSKCMNRLIKALKLKASQQDNQ